MVGRLIWYLVKVCMNCGYIHKVHGCAPNLLWAFCTEVLFTQHYRKAQANIEEPIYATRATVSGEPEGLARGRTSRQDTQPQTIPRDTPRRQFPDFLEGFCPAGCFSHSSEEAEAELQSLAKRPGDDWPAGQSAPLNNTLPRSRHRSGNPRRSSAAYEISELRQPPSYNATAPNLEQVIPRVSIGSRTGNITPP